MPEPSNRTGEIDKHALRNSLRRQRCDIDAQLRAAFDDSICRHLQELITTRKFSSIAGYWPFNGEPDLVPLFRQLMDSGCEVALPVISSRRQGMMKFCRWEKDMPLVENRFGIPEPPDTPGLSISHFELLVMPLVAYDKSGNRLGMGAGYYDRHLQELRHCRLPLRVGAAYSLQEVGPLAKNDWDIHLHGVVNERGWFTFVD
jgi:5-formyltetrahydrofolate cyclo-ligase